MRDLLELRVRAGLERFALLLSEIHLSTTAILREPSDMQDLQEVNGASCENERNMFMSRRFDRGKPCSSSKVLSSG